MNDDLVYRIKRKWARLRLQPICIFCFHQVSEQLNPVVHCKPDWMSLSEFQRKLSDLQKSGYIFISLQEAHLHLKEDKIRCKKYAVLTCDDGLKCQAALIPWLEEKKIPMTIFVTAKYLDGKSCGQQILDYFKITDKESERKLAEQLYLNEEDLMKIDSPLVTIGMHGYEHVDYRMMKGEEFETHVDMCKDAIQTLNGYIPFFAYPYGRHTVQTDKILGMKKVIPVYIDKKNNVNNANCIHREML